MPIGLYVHVPFCRTRCFFCAFSLQIHRPDREGRYLDALRREMLLHGSHDTLEERLLETVYFGGGTPTVLSPARLVGILDAVRCGFGVRPDAEITLEAHPDTIRSDTLHELVAAGFTRISFGAQSMDEHDLRRLGRRALSDSTVRAIQASRRAGFLEINLDLMYGLPGQDLAGWVETVEETLALDPSHVSCYALTIEPRTRFAVDLHRGEQIEPDPDTQNEMEDAAAQRLVAAGFHRYEISNFAKPGSACRHNLLHWTGGDYLGLGPSAQSYLDGRRFGNAEDPGEYLRLLEAGHLPIAQSECLTLEQRRRERVIFGLRLASGVDTSLLRETESPHLTNTVARLVQAGLLEEAEGQVRLTGVGRRFSDSVAVELL